MSKKKKYLILLTGILIFAAATAGIYLFVNPNTKSSGSYIVDKYSDVTNWCDTNLKDGKLSVNCEALLINIDTESCFDVQVITKARELKDLTVCEKNDNLSYTNDILGYKKLMPVDIIFTYSGEGIFGDYSFNNVSFIKIDEPYGESVVNEDITDLVTIDSSTTSIKNSVDFCPRPENLPSYITDENKNKYTEYYNQNLMSKTDYNDSSFYDWQNEKNIKLLYGSDSQITAGYSVSHSPLVIDLSDILIQALLQNPMLPQFGNPIDEVDSIYLKQISAIYDNSSMISSEYKTDYLFHIVDALNTNSRSEEVFCGTYKLLKLASITKPVPINPYLDKIYDSISNNISKLQSTTCANILMHEDIDYIGKYMKFTTSKNIMDRCINLNSFLENK